MVQDKAEGTAHALGSLVTQRAPLKLGGLGVWWRRVCGFEMTPQNATDLVTPEPKCTKVSLKCVVLKRTPTVSLRIATDP